MNSAHRHASTSIDPVFDLALIIQVQQEIATFPSELPELLDFICRRSREVTLAESALIEWVDGEMLVYRSASGPVSSYLGLRLKIDGSLSGQCVRTGEVLYCADSETDARVDRVACQKVGARSMIVVPLQYLGRQVGVLKVLAADPHFFQEREITLLRLMSGLLSAAIARTEELEAKSRALEQLRESETKFRQLVEAAYDAVVITEAGVIIEVNDSFCTMFGRNSQEVLGKSILDFLEPESRRQAETRIRTGSEVPTEAIGLRQDGSRFYIEGVGKNFKWQGKNLRVATIRDISERKRDEEALRASEVALRETTVALQTLIDTSPVGIVVIGRDFNLELWNPACTQIFGWTAEEVLGRPLPFVPDEKRAESNGFMITMSHTRQRIETEADRQRKDGQWIRLHISTTPLLNDQNEVTGFMGVILDITEQSNREVELRKANKALLEATKAKSEFLANMSHEIRTPINGVIGMTSLLLETELSPEQRGCAETVRNSADQLLTLVNDILDFSKVEAGKISFEIIDFSIDQLVQDIEKTLGFEARKKNLPLCSTISPDLPDFIQGDPTRVRQVLLNLVNNALKFTSRGHVTIDISKTEQGGSAQLLFEITDTGLGIPESAIQRIFEAFSQADASTTRRFGGTGLGLSICKRLIDLMQGRIGVKSEPGLGSTFWFSIPLVAGTQPQTLSLEPADNVGLAIPRLRLLIAEDNSVNQIIVQTMLKRMGHATVTVANGQEAIEAVQATPYDLILMDCQMPELDGYEATRRIRESSLDDRREIPIIAMTANAMAGDRERCLAAGMTDYVSKPMKLQDLETVIHRVFLKHIQSTKKSRLTAA